MSIGRVGRSPLGSAVRSPLGALGRDRGDFDLRLSWVIEPYISREYYIRGTLVVTNLSFSGEGVIVSRLGTVWYNDDNEQINFIPSGDQSPQDLGGQVTLNSNTGPPINEVVNAYAPPSLIAGATIVADEGLPFLFRPSLGVLVFSDCQYGAAGSSPIISYFETETRIEEDIRTPADHPFDPAGDGPLPPNWIYTNTLTKEVSRSGTISERLINGDEDGARIMARFLINQMSVRVSVTYTYNFEYYYEGS